MAHIKLLLQTRPQNSINLCKFTSAFNRFFRNDLILVQPGTWIKPQFVRIIHVCRRWCFDTSFGRRQRFRLHRRRKIATERKLSKGPDIWRVFIRCHFYRFEKRTSGTRQCEGGRLQAIHLCGFQDWLYPLSVRHRLTARSLGIGFAYSTILGGAQPEAWQQFWHVPIFIGVRSVFVILQYPWRYLGHNTLGILRSEKCKATP
jgi:hypothetical protein